MNKQKMIAPSTKEQGFVNGMLTVFGGILLIVVAVNLIPTLANALTAGKNAAGDANVNNSLASVLPLYAIVPIVVVVGIVIGILATFASSQ